MNLDDFPGKKCNSGKNIQFRPKKHVRFNLEKAVSALEELGAEIEIETPSLLIFRFEGTQVDMNASGKTIVKIEDMEKAGQVFSSIFSAVQTAFK